MSGSSLRTTSAPIGLAPVHFFSHGSTAMLGKDSKSADHWKACGDIALENGIKHVVIMVSVSFTILFHVLPTNH